MEIVYRKLSDLRPNPKNPRKATQQGIKKLAESISENPAFFEARPILLSDRTGELVIIGGEQRSKAAALLKMDKVPTILMSGLDEAAEDEVLVLDNTHSGVWDEQKLAKWDRDQLEHWNVQGVKWPERPVGFSGEDNLPAELLGVDLAPDELPQIVGDDKTDMLRVIIVFSEAQQEAVKKMLGLTKLGKVVYAFSELGK